MENHISDPTEMLLDPETLFLASKEDTGNEWELFKENVRPLKRGRNVRLLNHALISHTHNHSKKSLLQTRRRLIEAIDEYQGDDPLHPWLLCIKWVQESFPPGGDFSGLILLYEQCVRAFWHSDRYKDDLRYLKVWLEYAENCNDAQVIYSFLDANEIGKSYSIYYIAYALHLESKSKTKAANDIFNLGISRDAQPEQKLKDAYKKFLLRSTQRPTVVQEDSGENHLPARSFGTILASAENRMQRMESSDLGRKNLKPDRIQESVHSDRFSLISRLETNAEMLLEHQPAAMLKANINPWPTLGARAERNKENNAIPTKWTAYKCPQKPVARPGAATASACIEVFVDEECTQMDKSLSQEGKDGNSWTLQLREGDGLDIKKETELLRENPLRNFPLKSLPR